ncbi:tyrosine-type recombinase/integrase [Actinophytocola xanthii]|uniref:Site-specific integrase n=1 Tax=Actinophytocola xanthii TaxID=1912961 RepID=A0A1Q8CX43_9PSEU|nr:site-specific integrase [Actinophytocola xanthii]OLF18927.1 site-specific integrase [Actinophytocola xanthii]
MGHIQDRWYRPKKDPETDQILLNARGKPIMEKTENYGLGLRYRVRYLDPDNEERSKSFPDKQKKRAEDFLIEVESDKREGKYVDPEAGRKKFRQVAENWIKGQSPDAATRNALRSRLESQIYPHFGNLPVGSIKPSTVRDWLGYLDEKKFSQNYKVALFNAVSGVLESAIEDKLTRDNPCKAKTIRRPVASSPQVTVWPEERVRTVRKGLPERFSVVVPLGAGLGMRQGEILGVSLDDFDGDEMVLNLTRQIRIIDRTLVFAPPKGGKTRTVPVSTSVLAEVEDHERRFPSVAVTLPWKEPGGEPVTVRLLVTGDGRQLYSGDLFHKVVWHGAFRVAGVEYRKREDGMHALRHFYASVLLSQGVSIKELADYLGHADPGFTLRTYTHLVPSSHERARVAVDGVFGRPAPDDGLETA